MLNFSRIHTWLLKEIKRNNIWERSRDCAHVSRRGDKKEVQWHWAESKGPLLSSDDNIFLHFMAFYESDEWSLSAGAQPTTSPASGTIYICSAHCLMRIVVSYPSPFISQHLSLFLLIPLSHPIILPPSNLHPILGAVWVCKQLR